MTTEIKPALPHHTEFVRFGDLKTGKHPHFLWENRIYLCIEDGCEAVDIETGSTIAPNPEVEVLPVDVKVTWAKKKTS